MSLLVNAYYYKDGKKIDIPPESDANDLAGTENMRQSFYGSEASIKLGLKLLPTLSSESFLQVEGSDLKHLEIEVLSLLEAIKSEGNSSSNQHRLNNILAAIFQAKQYGQNGGVLIG